MKHFFKSAWMLSVAVLMYSCINDADVPSAPANGGDDSFGNLALNIEIPNAGGTRSAESSGVFDQGSEDEYAVKSLTVYLYDAYSGVLRNSYQLENIRRVNGAGGDDRIQYAADKLIVDPGTYNIFAIANGQAVGDMDTQEKFLNAVDGDTYSIGKIPSVPDAGFVMTNRGAANLNVLVSEPAGADKVTTVKISLERVVAKVAVGQSQETFPLKDPEGGEYATVKLNNFRMLNLATRFFTFRHTAVLDSFEEPSEYTADNFGDIADENGYLIDPYFFKKVEDAEGFTNADKFYTQALVDLDEDGMNDGNWAGMTPTGEYSHIYCLENCMYQPAQKNAYSTGVMFKANIAINPNRLFNADGEVFEGELPAKVFYFNYNFYVNVEAIRKLVVNNLPANITDNSSDEDLAKYNIKRFKKEENYSCYYNYWIRHEDNHSETEMGVMEFGIVRNNIYKLTVSKIAGLGSGTPHIDPDQPDEYNAELDINFEVLPWVVRDQDVELK